MGNLQPDVNVVLIGGSSHAGKSTVSESLAATLGWEHLSTDRQAAHPGRPWRPVPEVFRQRIHVGRRCWTEWRSTTFACRSTS